MANVAAYGASDRRSIRLTRWGLAENPIGRDAVFPVNGIERLARIVGVYQRNGYNTATMLRLRYFCGDEAPDIHVGAVKILLYPGEV